ncbi:endonuclease G, mitochondrial [Nephila pilipes]|uniref:Endonuclease G, mitochondrial n=1 Tax=Nephila pilipes TaxID=299642 RepID=A0A8X6QL71_NEPPI|nr:endonuclease G, mitochondrial [Nephila pilipes]
MTVFSQSKYQLRLLALVSKRTSLEMMLRRTWYKNSEKMAFRYSVFGSVVGFFGGVLYRDRWPMKKLGVQAANPVELPVENSVVPVVVSDDLVLETMKFGFPSLDTIRSRKSFLLSYDRRNRVPHWVFEHLTEDHIESNGDIIKSNEFFEDASIDVRFRSTEKDYLDSGFDKGHLAAAGNHLCNQEYRDDTFVLSNIAPQVGKGFNQDKWNKLEEHVRKLVKNYKNVYVCTGPLYMPSPEPDGRRYIKYQVIGPHDVAVPTHFFKIVIGERKKARYDMEAYVMPNAPIDDKVPLKDFFVSREDIEKYAGFLLFEGLPDFLFDHINGRKQICCKRIHGSK